MSSSLEGTISKPKITSLTRVIRSSYQLEIFVHHEQISGKYPGRLRNYPKFSVIFRINNKKSRLNWRKNYFSIFNNYQNRDITIMKNSVKTELPNTGKD